MDKRQYSILKILKTKTSVTDWNEEERQIVDYLCSQGLCECETDNCGMWQIPNDNYYITEEGRSALYDYRKDHIRFRIPLVLSIIAIIISILALLKP